MLILRNKLTVVFGVALMAGQMASQLAFSQALMPPAPATVPVGAAPQVPIQPMTQAHISDRNSTDQVVHHYKLGASDRVRIIVYGEPDLSGEFVVSGTGKLSLPLIGEVQGADLTISELQDEIAAKLREGYLKDPRVSAEVLTFRPFYILGEVSKPGEYPYSDGLTVLIAVAEASGFTYRAEKRKVFIKHANDAREIEVPLTQTVPVEPGDTIRIGERYF